MAEDNPNNEERRAEIQERLRKIRGNLRITKITCTRSVKGRGGDSFVGFSAAFQSVQDDHGGMGADVMTTASEDEVLAEQGVPLADAKVARLMLSLEVDLAALESAAANGSIDSDRFRDSVTAIKKNYNRLVLRALGDTDNGRDG